ncbi:MAG: DedA family protein [Candidatus Altarchaeaceae archaeon]
MIVDSIIELAVKIIEDFGYIGIFVLMLLESTATPIPSEGVMPFAGFLIHKGKFDIILSSSAGAIGSLTGALISYYIGKFFGRKFIIKYGKYLLITEKHLIATENFFNKYGSKAIFFARFVPVVRHLISFPAGIGKMNILKFSIYTFLGSFIWCFILAYLGYILAENWKIIRDYTEILDYFIILVIIIIFIWFLMKFKNKNKIK